MLYTSDCYRRFRCLAARCPDNCCHGWDVAVDEPSAARYRALGGDAWADLRRSLVTKDNKTCLQNAGGRCPMQLPDGLCRLQSAFGQEGLCEVCRDYPRLRHEYDGFTELDLDLGCPEAARLILTCQEPPARPRTDDPALAVLIESRAQADALLTARPLPQALSVVLLYGCHVQALLDGQPAAGFDENAALETARAFSKHADMEGLLSFFSGLEILSPQWPERLLSPAPAPWSQAHRSLARYFVRRFWLQAAGDGDLYARVKLILTSTLVIRALGSDTAATAWAYAREVCSDPENLDALLDGAYTCPAMTDDRLLGALLDGGVEGL